MVTPESLREALNYCPETGVLTWLPSAVSNRNRLAGKAAGSPHQKGYLMLQFDGHFLLAHRVGWAIHFGEWPSTILDHINRDKTDNRIANLRLASWSMNEANKTKRRAPTSSEYKWVCLDKRSDRWQARVCGVSAGYFCSEIEAAKAADRLAFARYGAAAVLNFPEVR